MTCQLCQRDVERITTHHLKPKSRKRKNEKVSNLPTALLCPACHRQIHALFTNIELASDFDSVEKLSTEPRMQKFIAWIRKQDANKRVKVRS